MADKDIDLKKIKELIELMKQNGLEELEIKQDDKKIFLKRHPQSPPATAVTAIPFFKQESVSEHTDLQNTTASNQSGVSETEAKDDDLVEITSPIVGTFYAKPSPDSESYVEIGSTVAPYTVVCIIEAMKVMNEIKAETRGIIVESLVTDGQAVEYGQVLYKVRPD
ncbi:acetyl-CoA carboxylase biotin carboxyl carrier protein [Planctomycetota bacterium]